MEYREVQEIVEATVNACASRLVAPLAERVTRIEEKLDALVNSRAKRHEAVWKVVAIVTALPACFYAILRLLI